jgi:hypothetical protein
MALISSLEPPTTRCGSSARPSLPAGRPHRFERRDALFPTARPLPFLDWPWGRIVASLRTASYLITGRHHAVYAACVARVIPDPSLLG